jgi:hypothetical protein
VIQYRVRPIRFGEGLETMPLMGDVTMTDISALAKADSFMALITTPAKAH